MRKIRDLQEIPHPTCGHLLPEGEGRLEVDLRGSRKSQKRPEYAEWLCGNQGVPRLTGEVEDPPSLPTCPLSFLPQQETVLSDLSTQVVFALSANVTPFVMPLMVYGVETFPTLEPLPI